MKASNLNEIETLQLLKFSDENGYSQIIHQRHHQFEIQSEKNHARNGLSVNLDDFQLHDGALVRSLVVSELSLVPSSSKAKILFVGAGALPYTAVYAQRYLGSRITLADKDPEAIGIAKDFVQSLGLKDRFRFIVGDIGNLDVSSFDVIWLAAMVTPKDSIVRDLANKLRPGAHILARQVGGMEQLLYGPLIDFKGVHGVSVKSHVDNYIPGLCRTVLLDIE